MELSLWSLQLVFLKVVCRTDSGKTETEDPQQPLVRAMMQSAALKLCWSRAVAQQAHVWQRMLSGNRWTCRERVAILEAESASCSRSLACTCGRLDEVPTVITQWETSSSFFGNLTFCLGPARLFYLATCSIHEKQGHSRVCSMWT